MPGTNPAYGRLVTPPCVLGVLSLLALAAAAAATPTFGAQSREPATAAADAAPPAIGPRLGGRLAQVDADALDLVGDVWADVPFAVPGAGDLFTAWFARSAITDTTSDFAFTVRDLEYRLDLGWRFRLRGGTGLSFSAGQRGRSEVDHEGAAWVRFVGLGLASRDFGRSGTRESPAERVSYSLTAGPVLQDSNVAADALVHGAARARLLGERLALDLELDGLVDGGETDFDLTLGPSFGFFAADGRRMALFLRYLDAGNPLGIRTDAWLAGFEYEEGPASYVPSGGPSGADIGGTLALGAGRDRRESAQLLLRFLAPPLGAAHRIAFVLDTNVLTGDDTDELYYLYRLGLERVLRDRPRTGRARAIVGGYFYHRSNHQLEHAGGVTSLNVAEVAAQTPGWQVPGLREPGRRGTLDGRVGVGYLLSSDFGLDQRWHAHVGLRWQLPVGDRIVPFLRSEAELGEVNRRLAAVGVMLGRFEIQVERRTDDQYFGVEREATLLTAGYAF